MEEWLTPFTGISNSWNAVNFVKHSILSFKFKIKKACSILLPDEASHLRNRILAPLTDQYSLGGLLNIRILRILSKSSLLE